MMSENRKEQVSAIVDDELDSGSQSVIDDLLKTPSLKASWARYHLISDSLQHNMPEAIDTGLAARISASIQDEPTILAPRPTSNSTLIKPVAGFAIAASVAAMAILGIQQNREEGPGIQEQAVVSFTPRATVNSTANQQTALNTPTEAQLRQVKANTNARLNSYLVNYNEHRKNSGFQGMLPYVRTVTFENNK
jgi:sigma-E factor negative regulatory protein RseA